MRLSIIFLSILLLTSCESKKETVDCNRFHIGMFYLQQKPDSTYYDVLRNDSIQTEYNRVTDTMATFDVDWKSSCEYSVRLMNKRKMTPTDTGTGPVVEISNAIPVNVKIVGSGTTFYVFEARKEGVDYVYKDTMWLRQF